MRYEITFCSENKDVGLGGVRAAVENVFMKEDMYYEPDDSGGFIAEHHGSEWYYEDDIMDVTQMFPGVLIQIVSMQNNGTVLWKDSYLNGGLAEEPVERGCE